MKEIEVYKTTLKQIAEVSYEWPTVKLARSALRVDNPEIKFKLSDDRMENRCFLKQITK